MGYIYIIKNTINNKIYVGQTTRTIDIRWKEHRSNKSRLLNKDIKEFGSDNFIFIEKYEIQDDLLEKEEQKKIMEYDCIFPKGYNTELGNPKNLNIEKSSKGGKSDIGHQKHSEKLKEVYKFNPKLKNLPDVPRGISYWSGNKKGNNYEGFKVRKVGIKSKEFISSIHKNNLEYNLERSINYLNSNQK